MKAKNLITAQWQAKGLTGVNISCRTQPEPQKGSLISTMGNMCYKWSGSLRSCPSKSARGLQARNLKSLLRHTQPDENENGNENALCRINDAFSNINYCQGAARGRKDPGQRTCRQAVHSKLP